MASSATTPAYISALYEDLCYEVGGPFHPESLECYEQHPDDEIPDGAECLERWLRREFKDQTGSVDYRFKGAVQKWVERKLKMLHHEKKFVSDVMELASSSDKPEKSYGTLNFAAGSLTNSSHPVFEEEGDFVLVNDGADQQIAVLNEWKEQPSRLLARLPRIKAAFDYLKNR